MFLIRLSILPLLPLLLANVLKEAAAWPRQAVWSISDSIDFDKDVLYGPPEAWYYGFDGPCEPGVDIWTTQMNASVKIDFVGSRISVYGTSNNASGIMRIKAEDKVTQEC
ncbi:uncharacterized protein PHACADRAFT_211882 [Phanerochaete carnosa HHB-10118-sp]|uniref:Glycoside hydrolase family 16 protein n=1 Tax=Phanerochaete carnosa (strain HHB-10118-sp) TaxID=650164 RepID=K5WQL9_PHACS|nr:uncharacterized protein PHACADRAFT_211882 [Phanerochaete carnosa HHB-10118-sp]EKM52657.1 hypothetical protein PHACADRAFT_211882 [Phanerochaete carnosa HHB-10118-sp]